MYSFLPYDTQASIGIHTVTKIPKGGKFPEGGTADALQMCNGFSAAS